MVFKLEIEDPLDRVKAFVASDGWPTDIWDSALFAHLTSLTSILHSTTTPSPSGALATTTFLLTIPHSFCNSMNNLHGGCAATIYDLCTSIALAPLSKPGFWEWPGVSRKLEVEYLRPVPEGMTVVVSCEVMGIGRKLVSTRGWMREWDEESKELKGPVLTTCEHMKVNMDPVSRAKI